ncbi:MAG TPA: type II toxin-antitoxin system HicA family toxin [Actinomycetes bacterium]|nr:type II toxin-antitoxin system HicA family toxin [Actinomycetes bacterium]
MNVRQAIKRIEADGWRLIRQRGSHRQFKHPTKPGRVTVAGNDGDDLKPGTLASILRQAGLKGGGRDGVRGRHRG